MTPTKVLGTGPPLLLMHLNAKGAPKPLPVGNTKTKHEKSIVGKKDKQTKSAYKIPIDQSNELCMSHLCSTVS